MEAVVEQMDRKMSKKRGRKKQTIARPVIILNRVFFLNMERNKYVSVGLHVDSNYQAFVEFGKVKGASVFFNNEEWLLVINTSHTALDSLLGF